MSIDPWAELDAERAELAELCATLTDEQWDTPSLCDGWRVRDVIGHLTSVMTTGRAMWTAGLVRSGMNFNRWQAALARRTASVGTDALVSDMRDLVGNRVRPPVVKPIDRLVDGLLHHQDIRRPLGLRRDFPGERLIAVADRLQGFRLYGVPRRIAGLTFRMTDHEWTTGSGPLVEGPGEAVVVAMAGRAQALGDLAGDGLATLRLKYH